VCAEAAVPGFRIQSRELSLAQDKRDVVAALQINVGLRVDAVVNDDVEPVALADRRNGLNRREYWGFLSFPARQTRGVDGTTSRGRPVNQTTAVLR
jgi:hypothetical protein